MMTIKVVGLHLSYPWHTAASKEKQFKVEKIIDSVEFMPGQLLDMKKVEELCGSRYYKVTIVPSASAR